MLGENLFVDMAIFGVILAVCWFLVDWGKSLVKDAKRKGKALGRKATKTAVNAGLNGGMAWLEKLENSPIVKGVTLVLIVGLAVVVFLMVNQI